MPLPGNRPAPRQVAWTAAVGAAVLIFSACSSGGTPTAVTSSAAAPTGTPASSATPAAPSGSPTAAATSTQAAKGTFHAVDGQATGSAFLFHLANGSFVVTLEDFSIASAAHTDVILVPNKDVAKTTDIDRTTIVDLGPLKGTSGMQDFPVPASADAMRFHTVVLWDTQMLHAVAAAPLGRP